MNWDRDDTPPLYFLHTAPTIWGSADQPAHVTPCSVPVYAVGTWNLGGCLLLNHQSVISQIHVALPKRPRLKQCAHCVRYIRPDTISVSHDSDIIRPNLWRATTWGTTNTCVYDVEFPLNRWRQLLPRVSSWNTPSSFTRPSMGQENWREIIAPPGFPSAGLNPHCSLLIPTRSFLA